MAINKIIGGMLSDNLERNGTNLSFETDLLYVDVLQNRIGIKTTTPEADFDLSGIFKVNDILLIGNSISNRLSTGFVFDLDSNDLNVNLSKITNLGTPVLDNDASTKLYVDNKVGGFLSDRIISGDGKLVISSIGIDTTLNLTANQGLIQILNITNTDADFQTNVLVNDSLVVNGLSQLNNISIFGTTISTDLSNDLNITSSGGTIFLTGDVRHSTTSSGEMVYTDVNNNIISNPSFQFNGNLLQFSGIAQFDNIILDGDTVSTTNNLNISAPNVTITGTSGIRIETTVDNNIVIATPGTGILSIESTTSLTIPTGGTIERPTTPEQGAIRFNINLNHPEVYNGAEWTQFGPAFAGLSFQQIVPDGVSVSYNLDENATSASILVSLNGIIQTPDTAYTVSGNTIIFTSVPLTNDIISIRFLSAITSVQSITDSLGDTLIEAVTSEVHIDVSGNRKISVTDNFTELSTIMIPDTNRGRDLGIPQRQFNNVHVNTVGTDFVGDNIYSIGTVMIIGGLNEVTASLTYADPSVVGVILIDDATTTATISTSGRAICSVEGTVTKGDLLTTSNTSGTATVLNPIDYVPGCVIGKSLQDFPGPSGNINIIVSIF